MFQVPQLLVRCHSSPGRLVQGLLWTGPTHWVKEFGLPAAGHGADFKQQRGGARRGVFYKNQSGAYTLPTCGLQSYPFSVLQDSTAHLPTLCLLGSSTPGASRACLQMAPTFSQDIVLTRCLHLLFSQVLKLNMSHVSSASFPSTLLLLGSSQSLP